MVRLKAVPFSKNFKRKSPMICTLATLAPFSLTSLHLTPDYRDFPYLTDLLLEFLTTLFS
nr:MAG TPA: hypothetical protein [Caudoviricetes sp.]